MMVAPVIRNSFLSRGHNRDHDGEQAGAASVQRRFSVRYKLGILAEIEVAPSRDKSVRFRAGKSFSPA